MSEQGLVSASYWSDISADLQLATTDQIISTRHFQMLLHSCLIFQTKINKPLFWTDMPWLQMTPKKSVWPIFCIVLVQFFIVQELFHSKINLVIARIFISLQNLTRKKASNGPLMCNTPNPLSFSRNLSWNPPMQLHSQQPGFKKFSNCFKS